MSENKQKGRFLWFMGSIILSCGLLLFFANLLFLVKRAERDAFMAPFRALTSVHGEEARAAVTNYLFTRFSREAQLNQSILATVMTGNLLEEAIALRGDLSIMRDAQKIEFREFCVLEYSPDRMKIYSEHILEIHQETFDEKQLAPYTSYFYGVFVFFREGLQWKVAAWLNFLPHSDLRRDYRYGVPEWEKELLGDVFADADAFYTCSEQANVKEGT